MFMAIVEWKMYNVIIMIIVRDQSAKSLFNRGNA